MNELNPPNFCYFRQSLHGTAPSYEHFYTNCDELINDATSVCVGTIISATQIVTARHCFGGEKFKFGDISYSTPLCTEVVTFYNSDVAVLESCEIAVVSLPQPILFCEYAMTIKLTENQSPQWANG